LIWSICFWLALAGFLERSTAMSSGPFAPAPNAVVRPS
jgi:hypothetical protein